MRRVPLQRQTARVAQRASLDEEERTKSSHRQSPALPAPASLRDLADVINASWRTSDGMNLAPSTSTNAGTGKRAPVQRRKKEAKSFISEHDLNELVRPNYESISEWVSNYANPKELRDGLRDAWNHLQAAHWRIPDADSPDAEKIRVRMLLRRAGELVGEARKFFIPFPQPPERQYLVNRLERLAADYDEIRAEFDRREGEGTLSPKSLARMAGRLRSRDFLPLLESTLPQARLAEPALSAKLSHVFEQSARAKKAVRYADIAPHVERAAPTEREAVGDDDDLLGSAARLLAPEPHLVPSDQPLFNDAPEFVKGLDVQHTGSVTPHNEVAVDRALRRVLGAWVRGAVRRNTTVHGSTHVLKGPIFAAVQKKYSLSIGGGGSANAFTEEGRIYLNANLGDASTIVHEGVHLYAHGAFRPAMGGALDEGVTEHFARMVAATLGFARHSYAVELANATRLIGLLDENVVAEAYFSGDMAGLRSAFLRKLHARSAVGGDGSQEWADFKTKLGDRKWDEAFSIIS